MTTTTLLAVFPAGRAMIIAVITVVVSIPLHAQESKLTGGKPASSKTDKSVITADPAEFVIVIGAAGATEYEASFNQSAQRLFKAATDAGCSPLLIGPVPEATASDADTDHDALQQAIKERSTGKSPLWIVMVGHGTVYQNVAKFNLRGPDVSATELEAWLEPVQRPIVIVNCSSASAPFINRLSAPSRLIVTATKSATEIQYARFGEYFAAAIGSNDSDLDHDGEVSVLEAFLRANSDVEAFYQAESRISTEHALIDDNGDERGTTAKLFRGLRVAKAKNQKPTAVDGKFARRITLGVAGKSLPLTDAEIDRRREIEDAVLQTADLPEDDRIKQTESLLIELARLYQTAEDRQNDVPQSTSDSETADSTTPEAPAPEETNPDDQ